MPTVFEMLSDGFYTAFFEPNADKRGDKIEEWIKISIPVIQSAVENELRRYLEETLKDTWEEKGWKARAQKYYSFWTPPVVKKDTPKYSFIDVYQLNLEIKLLNSLKENKVITGELKPEVREKTNKAIEGAKKAIEIVKPINKTPEEKMVVSSMVDDESDDSDEGRSPNDDRSDSMNPNNDSYQASMDNRSDQMNPNNDAYWSSRGS